MNQKGFENFLIGDKSITSKDKAVRSRVSKALKVEKDFIVNLDDIVKDDDSMYKLLIRIQREMNENNGNYQNAVRKYYMYRNGKEFPRLKDYAAKNK